MWPFGHELQMVTISRAGAGGIVGKDRERMAGMLRSIAATASVLLSQKKGNVREVGE